MKGYREAALESASSVELVVALYDGLIRFLLQAAEACDSGDVEARRAAVRRSLDIVIHLQARLRPDVGGAPALHLGEFYASVFALVLRASAAASREQFFSAVQCVRSVREAWQVVAQGHRAMPRDLQTYEEQVLVATSPAPPRASELAEQKGSWLA